MTRLAVSITPVDRNLFRLRTQTSNGQSVRYVRRDGPMPILPLLQAHEPIHEEDGVKMYLGGDDDVTHIIVVKQIRRRPRGGSPGCGHVAPQRPGSASPFPGAGPRRATPSGP